MAEGYIPNNISHGTWVPDIPRMNISSIIQSSWYRAGNIFIADISIVFGTPISGQENNNIYLNAVSLPCNGGNLNSKSLSGIWSFDDEIGSGNISCTTNNSNGWFCTNTGRIQSYKFSGKTMSFHLFYTVDF